MCGGTWRNPRRSAERVSDTAHLTWLTKSCSRLPRPVHSSIGATTRDSLDALRRSHQVNQAESPQDRRLPFSLLRTAAITAACIEGERSYRTLDLPYPSSQHVAGDLSIHLAEAYPHPSSPVEVTPFSRILADIFNPEANDLVLDAVLENCVKESERKRSEVSWKNVLSLSGLKSLHRRPYHRILIE